MHLAAATCLKADGKMASFDNGVEGVSLLGLFLACWLGCVGGQSDYPANEYFYSLNRDALIDAERKFEKRDSYLTSVSLG